MRPLGARGSVLVIVMWIAFGLVSLALYLGHSMANELRAADNRVAGVEAEQAIEGAARYVALVLSNNPGVLPDPKTYQCEAVAVGDATFWIIGRADTANAATAKVPTFGLVDEASKFNLNTVVLTNLVMLPRMTDNLAGSILNWAGKTNNDYANLGASSQTYATLKTPYSLKGSNYETVAELRLVYGMDMDTLYGEDANLNGFLDPNEDDADFSPPSDNHNGRLEPGLIEYFTVYTSDPNQRTNGGPRISVTSTNEMITLLTSLFGDTKARQIFAAGMAGGAPSSVAQYYSRIQGIASSTDFEQFYDDITVDTNSPLRGQINVNTAKEEVLAALDGFTTDTAAQLVAYRRSNPGNLRSVAWIYSVLGTNIPPSARVLTTHTYQFTADIAALGHHDRGYRRVQFVFDTSNTNAGPTIIYRRDLTHLGWALGPDIQDQMLTSKDKR